MTEAAQRNPEVDNPVSSFDMGILTFQGAGISICIKFAMYDRSTRITHWSPRAFKALTKALEEYAEHLGLTAFMFRAKNDPSLVANLSPRHPYHTLLSEAPKLNDGELGTASLKTAIDEAKFVICGPTFEIHPVYGDGRKECIFIHEYTALSLVGYLKEYMNAAVRLVGPTAGNA